ncbi:stress-activated map kinase interacting protein 1-domain-containing protein [Gymnopilus junonius]|uniref:Stress-activated map kinase interacting protein 1-domain-containing protein n=1 Tax=Gymnopilus junonius TaxID=109634 RepID=A0A9P5NGJ3_GYMJU|nr:stress-activated map kinase interacting protein 1-domain-containing protein [Gymnopilus junonius]
MTSYSSYLIHSLRLAYLRDVEDPYGPRIISLDPSYQSNPYILAASLADVDRCPQLVLPSSPNLSEDEQERPLGLPGARLKHTQTIMGGRSGGLGLRVNAKRLSTSKRMSATPRQADPKKVALEDAPAVEQALPGAAPSAKMLAQSAPGGESWIKIEDSDSEGSPEPSVQVHQATAPEEAPVTKAVQFIPKFKGAEEMEARRRIRMAARRGPGAALARAAPPPNLSFSSSSEDEAEAPAISDDSSDEFEVVGQKTTDEMDEGDEFDPVFAATRTTSDSASDATSMFSPSSFSVVNSSIIAPSSQTNTRSRTRLSPVSERPGRTSRQKRPEAIGGTSRTRGDSTSTSASHAPSPSPSAQPPAADNIFVRKKVPSFKPLKSSLSSMLASSSSSSNPFAEMYAAISGRGELASTNVQVYFPHAKQPHAKTMDLNVRKDATVEEVIGFALWSYWEEGWLPKLDEGLSGEDDPTEEDGEVDDDFPRWFSSALLLQIPADRYAAPDRMAKVVKFNADAYAILEATPNQIQQNKILESKIQRRPSRTSAAKKPEKPNQPNAAPSVAPASAAYAGSQLGSMLSTSLGPSSSHGPQIFLRIRVADTADAVHISTTIEVTAGMYMQEALELVCRKRKLQNPNDYALLLADKSILIPLDRTVASLQGKTELLLVKRSMLPQMDHTILKGIGRTTDPNASIFKPNAETPEQQYSSALDYTAAYKKYTIYRKMPMLVTRQERTLAIDGVYIHIMPSTNKARAVFDSGKTSSYHIKSIADCQQSAKTSSTFKIILNRGAGSKRYDFEAESPKMAAEIVQTIRNLKTALERTGTVNKARRSRQVV